MLFIQILFILHKRKRVVNVNVIANVNVNVSVNDVNKLVYKVLIHFFCHNDFPIKGIKKDLT